jgi:putative FmdB family regulatory protein
MPTYEYECQKCEHRFERFQNMSAEPIKTCPECGGNVDRLISGGAGVIIKGSITADHVGGQPSCGRHRPCCGRDTVCDSKPCES